MAYNPTDPRSAIAALYQKPVRTIAVDGISNVKICDPDPSRVSILVVWADTGSPVSVGLAPAITTQGITGMVGTGVTLVHTATYPLITQGLLYAFSGVAGNILVYETCLR